MPRRELLTEAQREVLIEPTTDERTMVRYSRSAPRIAH
jgi:hypothetical protein